MDRVETEAPGAGVLDRGAAARGVLLSWGVEHVVAEAVAGLALEDVVES